MGKVRSFRDTRENLYAAIREAAQGEVSNRKCRRCNPALTMASKFSAQHAALLRSLHPADKGFGYPMPRAQIQGAAQVSDGCLVQNAESEPS